ncbi:MULTISPECIES: FtsW/RodA/SpoVE family cell cycle protein [unclassified Bacteroides]|uniref:FtsW/RodA/SpoVE family cell cycle protein n=1 Tax=unclassified Bacteroides TaxID=2646097 RepID=UPI00068DD0D7|nr:MULTISPECIES: FtsW/RodA/SpoVE family cell cycle protein [unclassified Bacteroides]
MNIFSLKDILKGDKIIWIVYLFLCTVSLIEVFSADSRLTFKSNDLWAPITKHSILLFGGILVAWLVHRQSFKYFRLVGAVGYIVSIILLVLTKFIGQETNGSTRWISLFGFQFQPSEIAKLSIILLIANIISKGRDNTDGKLTDKTVNIALGVTAPVFLLILSENFSTSMLLFVTVLCMLFIGKMKARYARKILVSIALFCGTTFVVLRYTPPQIFKIVSTFVPATHRAITWQNRLKNFGSERVPADSFDLDKDAQIAHANIAIASSHGVGKMPGNSSERDFLSQASSDFIFAIIIEETGLLGAGLVMFMYIVLVIKIGQIASRCKTVFPMFTLIGIALIISIQAITNMAVAVSIIPVTGQPLPFVSRGGSSIIISGIYIGIILSISRYVTEKEDNQQSALPKETAIETTDYDDEDNIE